MYFKIQHILLFFEMTTSAPKPAAAADASKEVFALSLKGIEFLFQLINYFKC
jgi:hypothetical protein